MVSAGAEVDGGLGIVALGRSLPLLSDGAVVDGPALCPPPTEEEASALAARRGSASDELTIVGRDHSTDRRGHAAAASKEFKMGRADLGWFPPAFLGPRRCGGEALGDGHARLFVLLRTPRRCAAGSRAARLHHLSPPRMMFPTRLHAYLSATQARAAAATARSRHTDRRPCDRGSLRSRRGRGRLAGALIRDVAHQGTSACPYERCAPRGRTLQAADSTRPTHIPTSSHPPLSFSDSTAPEPPSTADDLRAASQIAWTVPVRWACQSHAYRRAGQQRKAIREGP